MKRWIRYGITFLLIFILCAFLTTASMLLLTSGMGQGATTILKSRALLGLLNVIGISLIITAISLIANYLILKHTNSQIQKGVDAISSGDFSYRIKLDEVAKSFLHYDEIADSINRMAEELQSTEILKTDFVANVSHELKTPLASISAYCELLQSPGQTEEERTMRIRQILRSVRKLSELITNILKLNKLENQQIYPNTKVYSLSAQVVECLLDFEDRWEAKELEIDTDIQDDVKVRADEELLSLVWNNLISNAIKFTDKGGLVKVSLKDNGDDISVTVQDTGCGISATNGGRIFDKFYQADTAHSTEGNGLGLSLVKRVIEIVDGRIEVESELGKGSSFTVYLNK